MFFCILTFVRFVHTVAMSERFIPFYVPTMFVCLCLCTVCMYALLYPTVHPWRGGRVCDTIVVTAYSDLVKSLLLSFPIGVFFSLPNLSGYLIYRYFLSFCELFSFSWYYCLKEKKKSVMSVMSKSSGFPLLSAFMLLTLTCKFCV